MLIIDLFSSPVFTGHEETCDDDPPGHRAILRGVTSHSHSGKQTRLHTHTHTHITNRLTCVRAQHIDTHTHRHRRMHYCGFADC